MLDGLQHDGGQCGKKQRLEKARDQPDERHSHDGNEREQKPLLNSAFRRYVHWRHPCARALLDIGPDDVLEIEVVVGTEILDDRLVGPRDVPARRPWPRIRLRIVDRDLVAQCVEGRTRDALDQMQRIGMHHAGRPARKPESLVESNGIDDERIVLPVTDRVAEESGHVKFEIRMLAAVHVNRPIAAWPAAGQDHDALALGVLDDVDAIRRMKLSRPAVRHAARMRVVFAQCCEPIPNERLRPRLERRDFVEILGVDEKCALHFDGLLRQIADTGRPMTVAAGRRAEIYRAIG